jgi:hypothetical protein
MRHFTLVALLSFALVAASCASTMNVTTTPPGAEVTVDGKPVGKAPVSTQVPSGGPPVVVKAKHDGKEVTKNVNRDDTNWGVVGAGAGAGVGTFCAGWLCSFGLGFTPLAILGIPVGCIGCASLIGMPVGAYFMWGAAPPASVTVDVAGAAPATAAPPPPSAPSTEPVAPSDGTPPPPPPEVLPY